MGQNYSQLTESERNQFYALRKAKMPMTEIAKQLRRIARRPHRGFLKPAMPVPPCCRWIEVPANGRGLTTIPFDEQGPFGALLCLLKTSLPKARKNLLTAKRICPIPTEPVQNYVHSTQRI